MNPTIKYVLAVGAGLIIGGLGVFAYSQTVQMNLISEANQQMTNLKAQNAVLQANLDALASNSTIIPQPSVSSSNSSGSAMKTDEKGSIEGVLGYPAEGIPPLVVYAFQNGDTKKYFIVETKQNQTQFAIPSVEAGSYTVVAYPQGVSTLAGGYTIAVSCGLTVSCTDHSLVIVEVFSGETAKGVEVKDWYAPEGTFPKKP